MRKKKHEKEVKRYKKKSMKRCGKRFNKDTGKKLKKDMEKDVYYVDESRGQPESTFLKKNIFSRCQKDEIKKKQKTKRRIHADQDQWQHLFRLTVNLMFCTRPL